MPTLVVISCGDAKIWKKNPLTGPTPAKAAYISNYFKLNRKYAEKFSDSWLILSAKYGFIEPDFVIPEEYNVTFKDKSTKPISISQLKNQVRTKQLDRFDRIVVIGGSAYVKKVRAAFANTACQVIAPVEGLSIGKIMGKVKRAILDGYTL